MNRDTAERTEKAPRAQAELDWRNLGLGPELLSLVEKAGFARPTHVQAETIPIVLDRRDLIASARTGSGKTASFCLPMIQSFMGRRGTYGLILCPTREIALQTQEAIDIFGKPVGVTSVPLIGGVDIKGDFTALKTGPQIIVGTPGRICDHLERGNLWLEFIEVLVLDEADKMLDMGFAKEVNRIVRETPKSRQTLLFSATIPPTIAALAKQILHDPERVAIGKSLSVSHTVDHEILWVNEMAKKRELLRLIHRERGSILVFVRTKDGATRLWRSIHAAGVHDSTYISSNKAQNHREEALQGFKDGRYRVMVATDVAGRGIHVENVSYVVNFDLPREPEDYIHRIGRTGRQEKAGRAISFATSHDRHQVNAIEQVLGKRIPSRVSHDFRESGRGEREGGGEGGRRPRRRSGPPRRR